MWRNKCYGLLSIIFLTLVLMVKSDESCNMDFERTLQTLFAPQEQPSPQIRSLRRYLISILHNMVARAEEVEGWNTYVYPKRSLEALARAGYLHTLPEDDDNQTESNDKRSLSALAKNGQLPIHQYRDEESYKRSSAPVGINRETQKMLDDLYSNLARDENLKRNMASIARDGGFIGKRNVAALLKNDRYLSHMLNQAHDKRNLASVKASYQPRYKRDADYYEEDEYPGLQNADGYEKVVEELLEGQRAQKRFLGSIAKSGWYDSSRNPSIVRSTSNAEKRHIGSLARLGWLPTIRNVRRFSRSGRSSSNSCRQASSDGQDQDYFVSDNSIPLDNKRFLPVPAMWKVPLRTFNY